MKIGVLPLGYFLKIAGVRTVGYSLVIISLCWLTFSLWPVATAEVGYRFSGWLGWQFKLREDVPQTFDQLIKKKPQKVIDPVDPQFGLVVEKIGANSSVVANVDAANEREYNLKLQQGVAHAKGTVFPGQKGNSFLFAHSVLNPWDIPRYNAVFYLLRELEVGDRVVAFYQNKRYNYTVFAKEVVESNDTGPLVAQYDYPVLTLQTCTPPGTTWKRLIVKAKM